MSIIIMILLISVLIIIHELGHFLAAKSIGITPERFGIGLPFGPVLFEKDIAGTIFCIHAFLLGGYVAFPEDNPDKPLAPDDPNRLDNKSILKRAWVVSAGVLANALFALLLVIFVAFASRGLPIGKYNIFINDLYPQSSTTASVAGFLPKDKIIEVENIKIKNPNVFMALLEDNKEANSKVTEADMQKIKEKLLLLNPTLTKEKIKKGTKIILPEKSFESPMTKATLAKLYQAKPDNTLYELNKKEQDLRDKIYTAKTYTTDTEITLKELVVAITDYKQPITIKVERNDEIKSFIVSPNKNGVIGIKLYIEEVSEPTTSIKTGLVNSWNYLSENTIGMLQGLGSIFTGKVPLKELHGIIAIAKVGGDVIQDQGIWKGFLLTAIISMNLAIINFLPIPALDGGHIFFLIIEALTGKKVNPDTQENIAKYGFLFLILLMFFVIFNDIFALMTNKF